MIANKKVLRFTDDKDDNYSFDWLWLSIKGI